DADRGPLARTDSTRFDIACDANPDMPSSRSQFRLSLPPTVIVAAFESCIEQLLEVQTGISNRNPVSINEAAGIRHVRDPDDIPPAHLDRIQAELASYPIQDAIHRKYGFNPSRPAVRAGACSIGENPPPLDPEIWNLIVGWKVVDRVG